MFKNILIIGSGGFLGSVARYLSVHYIEKYFPINFPIGILTVNIIGSLIIGFVLGLVDRNATLMTDGAKLFLAVGVCGGFTTFSSFANDNVKMLNSGDILSSALYISLSVFFCIVAVFFGKYLSNLF